MTSFVADNVQRLLQLSQPFVLPVSARSALRAKLECGAGRGSGVLDSQEDGLLRSHPNWQPSRCAACAVGSLLLWCPQNEAPPNHLLNAQPRPAPDLKARPPAGMPTCAPIPPHACMCGAGLASSSGSSTTSSSAAPEPLRTPPKLARPLAPAPAPRACASSCRRRSRWATRCWRRWGGSWMRSWRQQRRSWRRCAQVVEPAGKGALCCLPPSS